MFNGSRARLWLGPGLQALLDDIQRQGATAEQVIMEGAQVEGLTQFALGVLAEFLNFQLSDIEEGCADD